MSSDGGLIAQRHPNELGETSLGPSARTAHDDGTPRRELNSLTSKHITV